MKIALMDDCVQPLMIKVVLSMALLAGLAALAWSPQSWAGECPGLLQHAFPGLQNDKPQDLCQYQGKVLLVVNTASYCGNTGQYEGLEDLYARYKDQGLVVLGFPSNDFGGQEPGSNQEIAKFCRLTYGVQFPMFAKSVVVGPKRNEFFAQLAQRTGKQPRWNFHKYLIDRQGDVVFSFEHHVRPDDPNLVTTLRRLLDANKPLRRTT
ncbi:MAG: glutathione peroxidase [Pseudomonadota bacterium]